jgi:hypothetical protein
MILTGQAATLAGAVRRNFELIEELKKTDPQSAYVLYAFIATHLRSVSPQALLHAQVTP